MDNYASGYDPAKYHEPAIPEYRECECGTLLVLTVYKLDGKERCLSCALDEAGIEVERVDRAC